MKSHLFHVAGLHFHMTKQTLPTLFSWQSQSCVLLLLPLTDHMICTWAELEHTWGLMNSCNCDWLRVTMWHIDAWQSILLRDFLFLEGHKSTNAQWDSMYFVWRRSQTAVSLMPHQHRIMKLWRGFFEHENTTLALMLKSSPVKCWIKTFCLSLGPVPVWEIWLCVCEACLQPSEEMSHVIKRTAFQHVVTSASLIKDTLSTPGWMNSSVTPH